MRPKKYKTAAERQEAYRARKLGKVVTKSDNVTESTANVTEPVTFVTKPDTVGMTATDALFEAEDPGYWIWMRDAVKRKCTVCEKPFETRLELNRFCSPGCKQEMIRSLSTMKGVAA